MEKAHKNENKPQVDARTAMKSTNSSLRRTLSFLSNPAEEAIAPVVTTTQESTSTGDTKSTNNAAVTRPPPSSIPDNNKIVLEHDASPPPPLMQQQQQQQPSTLPSSKQQPQNITKKKMQQQTSTLTRKKIDYEGKSSIVDLWKRYDLAAPEGIAGQETGELQAVEKQVWKRRKIVPYNGINTIVS